MGGRAAGRHPHVRWAKSQITRGQMCSLCAFPHSPKAILLSRSAPSLLCRDGTFGDEFGHAGPGDSGPRGARFRHSKSSGGSWGPECVSRNCRPKCFYFSPPPGPGRHPGGSKMTTFPLRAKRILDPPPRSRQAESQGPVAGRLAAVRSTRKANKFHQQGARGGGDQGARAAPHPGQKRGLGGRPRRPMQPSCQRAPINVRTGRTFGTTM